MSLAQAPIPESLPRWLPGAPLPGAEGQSLPPQETTIQFTREPQAKENVEFSRAPVTPAPVVDVAAQEMPPVDSWKKEETVDFHAAPEPPAISLDTPIPELPKVPSRKDEDKPVEFRPAPDVPATFPLSAVQEPPMYPSRKNENNTVEFSRAPVMAVTFTGAATQDTPKYGSRKDEFDTDFPVTKELPGLDRLTRRESEKELFNRIRQETRKRPGSERALFPEEAPIAKEKYSPRQYPVGQIKVEPAYVCHGRLIFEQPNFERYGYDFGFFQPAVSTVITMCDVFTMPYQCCKRPFQQYDTSAGKCLPGDAVPLLLYPLEPSLTGLLGEGLAGVGLLFAFP